MEREVSLSMRRLALILAALGLAGAALPAGAQQQVQRHLVYDFSVGITNDTHDTNASERMISTAGGANASGTGDTQYLGLNSDFGKITVDAYGVEPDGGLIVKVSESTQHANRNAPEVECVVYPTTNVVCGDVQLYPEEMVILHTLSPKFFDPAALDTKRHWHEGSDAAGISLDFTVTGTSGNSVTILEDNNQKIAGVHGSTVHGTATYTYDVAKTIATQMKEYDTIRQQTGPGQYANITVDVTASLATDSVAAKN
jgi:hypothetical protein